MTRIYKPVLQTNDRTTLTLSLSLYLSLSLSLLFILNSKIRLAIFQYQHQYARANFTYVLQGWNQLGANEYGGNGLERNNIIWTVLKWMVDENGGAPPWWKYSLSLECNITMDNLPSVIPSALVHVISILKTARCQFQWKRTRNLGKCVTLCEM